MYAIALSTVWRCPSFRLFVAAGESDNIVTIYIYTRPAVCIDKQAWYTAGAAPAAPRQLAGAYDNS